MLYRAYQMQDDMLAPFRQMALTALGPAGGSGSAMSAFLPGQFAAAVEMLSRYTLTHSRPAFGITTGGVAIGVAAGIVITVPAVGQALQSGVATTVGALP